MEGTIACYGTYSVSEPDKALTLRVKASSFPNQVGADRKRTITELTGDQLKYENTTVLSGGQIHVVLSRLKLRRASKRPSVPRSIHGAGDASGLPFSRSNSAMLMHHDDGDFLTLACRLIVSAGSQR